MERGPSKKWCECGQRGYKTNESGGGIEPPRRRSGNFLLTVARFDGLFTLTLRRRHVERAHAQRAQMASAPTRAGPPAPRSFDRSVIACAGVLESQAEDLGWIRGGGRCRWAR